ncbi:hypothetical protein GCM10027511_02870 [Hymenobacter humi]
MLLPPVPRPTNVLALLFGGALVLSLGLNSWLLASWPDDRPTDESTELAATTADLHLTQRLLAHCQHHQQRQDSLLLALRTQASGPVVAGQ